MIQPIEDTFMPNVKCPKCCHTKEDLGLCTSLAGGPLFSLLILLFDVVMTKPKQYSTLKISVPSPTLSAHFEILSLERKCLPMGRWCSLQIFRPLYQFLQIIPSLSCMQHISWRKRQGKNISKQFSLLNLFQALLHCISHVHSPLPTTTFSWISGRCDYISTKSAENPAISCTRQSTNSQVRCHPHMTSFKLGITARPSASYERGPNGGSMRMCHWGIKLLLLSRVMFVHGSGIDFL